MSKNTQILWNGSKWLGEEPDSVEQLLEVLAVSTLHMGYAFRCAADFEHHDRTNHGWVCFFGNFLEVSHAFSIRTCDEALIARLRSAIETNCSSQAFVDALRAADECHARRMARPIGRVS